MRISSFFLLFIMLFIPLRTYARPAQQGDFVKNLSPVVHLVVTTSSGDKREGSGVIVTANGIIFTAEHVIEDAIEIRVEIFDQVEIPPKFAYYADISLASENIDFAILEITKDHKGLSIKPDDLDLPYIETWAQIVNLHENISIIGYMESAGGVINVTDGVISSIAQRSLDIEDTIIFYQSDAVFGEGDSGGAVIDDNNELVGIPITWEDDGGGYIVTILPIATICEVEESVCKKYRPTIASTAVPSATLTSQDSTPNWQLSCDWESDWQLQSDGSYLWVGLPPGTPGCERVGQSGTALENVQKGIVFTVDVGQIPLALDICRGQFRADTVINGTLCTSNKALMPKVAGKLSVRNSTGNEAGGFSVGN